MPRASNASRISRSVRVVRQSRSSLEISDRALPHFGESDKIVLRNPKQRTRRTALLTRNHETLTKKRSFCCVSVILIPLFRGRWLCHSSKGT